MNVIILEDEIPAFNKLSAYLLNYEPKANILAWFRSIEDALNNITLFDNCDLILSDIKLLDGISIELFFSIKCPCPIIFCTAYNKYLQDAFDTNGIAYLLKPYSQEDFKKAMKKYDQFFRKKESQPQLGKESISLIENIIQKSIKGYKQRFSIKKNDGIIVISTIDILYFQALGDFCTVLDNRGEKHNVNYKISILETLLDPQSFFRINRSEIIHITSIYKVESYFKNKMKILLTDGSSLTTSGSRTPEFRLWLDGK